MNAVDTNVFVYMFDKKEPAKQAKANAVFHRLNAQGAPAILVWQVLVESVQQFRRWLNLGDITEVEFDQHVMSVRSAFPVVFPSIRILDNALDLAKRYSLSNWDSMILGACKDAGVTTLYTEDMGAPTVIDGIQLLNPFV